MKDEEEVEIEVMIDIRDAGGRINIFQCKFRMGNITAWKHIQSSERRPPIKSAFPAIIEIFKEKGKITEAQLDALSVPNIVTEKCIDYNSVEGRKRKDKDLRVLHQQRVCFIYGEDVLPQYTIQKQASEVRKEKKEINKKRKAEEKKASENDKILADLYRSQQSQSSTSDSIPVLYRSQQSQSSTSDSIPVDTVHSNEVLSSEVTAFKKLRTKKVPSKLQL